MYRLYLPDGSMYNEIIDYSLQEIVDTVATYHEKTELRVVCNNDIDETKLVDALHGIEGITVSRWETNFFGVEASMSHNWASYQEQGMSYKRLDMAISSNQDMVKDVMLGSFGYIYEKGDDGSIVKVPRVKKMELIDAVFPLSLDKNWFYGVYNTNQELIGFFVLFLAGEELQLHSVGGRGLKTTFAKVENRIGVIGEAARDITLKTHFKKLTWTCSKSKVVQMYVENGYCIDTTRFGFKIVRN